MRNLLLSITCAFLLTACGGSSSSGGGGGNNPFAGVYSGNVPINFRFTGGVNDNFTETTFVTMTVNGDGTFSIVDGVNDPSSIRANGTLNENKFRASGSGSDSEDGVTCNLTLTYDGSIANNRATGTVNTRGNCSGLGTSANLTGTGNLSLAKRTNARTRNSAQSILNSLRSNSQ